MKTEKYATTLSAVTVAYAPYSNGLCERNHGVTDLMMDKIKEGDPSVSDQEALNYALNAKNMQTTRKGFSPYQIVYGSNPRILGIVDGNLASFETDFRSQDMKRHLQRIRMLLQKLTVMIG